MAVVGRARASVGGLRDRQDRRDEAGLAAADLDKAAGAVHADRRSAGGGVGRLAVQSCWASYPPEARTPRTAWSWHVLRRAAGGRPRRRGRAPGLSPRGGGPPRQDFALPPVSGHRGRFWAPPAGLPGRVTLVCWMLSDTPNSLVPTCPPPASPPVRGVIIGPRLVCSGGWAAGPGAPLRRVPVEAEGVAVGAGPPLSGAALDRVPPAASVNGAMPRPSPVSRYVLIARVVVYRMAPQELPPAYSGALWLRRGHHAVRRTEGGLPTRRMSVMNPSKGQPPIGLEADIAARGRHSRSRPPAGAGRGYAEVRHRRLSLSRRWWHTFYRPFGGPFRRCRTIGRTFHHLDVPSSGLRYEQNLTGLPLPASRAASARRPLS